MHARARTHKNTHTAGNSEPRRAAVPIFLISSDSNGLKRATTRMLSCTSPPARAAALIASLPLSLSLTLCLSLSVSLSLSRSRAHLSLPLPLSLSHTHSHTRARSRSHALALALIVAFQHPNLKVRVPRPVRTVGYPDQILTGRAGERRQPDGAVFLTSFFRLNQKQRLKDERSRRLGPRAPEAPLTR